jgi:hypothetical protein
MLAAAAVFSGFSAVHWLGRSYGATRNERRSRLPGDGIVPAPHLVTTHAITIHASPERVWPWLVQMGWGRGQWYTARWVDRLFFPGNGPSADRIVPEWQHLAVGDRIFDGPPEANTAFVVEDLEPDRYLVLHSTEHLPPGWAERFGAWIDFSWVFVVGDLGDGRTRFMFRSRARVGPPWVCAGYLALVPADFVMSRQMLRGVKRRAERNTTHSSPPARRNSGGEGSRDVVPACLRARWAILSRGLAPWRLSLRKKVEANVVG